MPAMSIAEANSRLTVRGSPFEMEEIEIAGRKLRVWAQAPPTLRDICVAMRQHAERVYLVYEDDRITYEEAFGRTAALARRLKDELGIEKGDRVAIVMRNLPEWPIAFWAIVSIGAIAVPLNAWWKGEELAYGLHDSGAKIAFCDEQRAKILRSLGLDLEAFVARPSGALVGRERPFDDAVQGAGGDLPDVAVDPEDDATIFYTSGTTGNPKGALGTHRNMCTNVVSVAFGAARSALRRGEAPPPPPPEQKGTLLSVPFFHATGCHSILAAGTLAGSKLVMLHKWNAERALELIERERLNSFGGVPAMVWQVLESPDFARHDTSTIERVGYGGAPAAPELVRRIREAFPNALPSNGYGLTESSSLTCSNTAQDYELKPDSVGPCVPICDVAVVDASGQELPTGQVGELWIRGPNIVKGYWNKPEATAETFAGGWLHTGDIARIDDEGFVYILDRAKDMLIRGGENIYCVEVEDVLYDHPAVMDAAVLGIPDRVLGEEPGAVVQISPGAEVTAEALRQYVAGRLAGFKVPVRIELYSEPLPRNANGKILKQQLKRELGWV